ncbi:Bacteriophage A118-like holin, Hol118 [Halobacillus karajensis]|uniref:holin n=1 Tax=Halobacillus karajensis TaxID=195088 RepID=UPI0008A7817D|nr:holin [Halobacillus karajensis]SEI03755.1 Bacteriophage A118-like holin, Hol118 [Halobacillus karajensis]
MENEIMTQVLMFATVISPFVAGLLEVIKRLAALPKNFIPLIAVVIGVILGVVAYPFTEMDGTMRLWAGAGAGLSATGLFELVQRRDGRTTKIKEDA